MPLECQFISSAPQASQPARSLVAQTSESAVSRVSKPAACSTLYVPPSWKSATQQTRRSALQRLGRRPPHFGPLAGFSFAVLLSGLAALAQPAPAPVQSASTPASDKPTAPTFEVRRYEVSGNTVFAQGNIDN